LGSTMQSHVLKRWFHLGVGQSIDTLILGLGKLTR
jgi:hypothetical protein